MRRLAIAGLVALVALAAAAAAAAAVDPSRALLRAFICQQAVAPAQREVYVQAVMRPVPGTMKLTMRFELLRRGKHERSSAEVAGPQLGNWISPQDPTLGQRPADQWVVDHPVVGLTAPADYQFRVTFRWLDLADRILATQVLLSRNCLQRDLGPDLLVQSIAVVAVAGKPNLDDYVAQIANAGGSATGTFKVKFSDGSVVQSRTMSSLRPHRTRLVSFSGLACGTAPPPTVTVDPNRHVDDPNPANNTLTASCPAKRSRGRLSTTR